MSDVTQNSKTISVLLSFSDAAAQSEGVDTPKQDFFGQTILGQSVISRQIAQLSEFGITHFLVAIDSLPGMLLSLSDQLAAQGIRVDFVRSPLEIAEKLDGADFIFVLAENVVADNQLITECLSVTAPYIATIDGREENRTFENIDLNTVWAGLSLLPADFMREIGDLPKDWSVTSSLLRAAVAKNFHRRPIPQALVQSGALQIIQSDADAITFGKTLISKQEIGVDGWIEQTIFAPAAKMLLPAIMRVPSIGKVLDFAPAVLAFTSLVLGASSNSFFAITIGIISLFLLCLRNSAVVFNPLSHPSKWVPILCYSILAFAAAALISRSELIDERFGFLALISAGLIVIANQIPLPPQSSKILRSPALYALSLLAGTQILGPVWTVIGFAMAQIGILLFSVRK
jgi:hypothetical protein